MIRRSAKLLAVYLLGLVLVAGWSLGHVLGGTVTSENAAAVIAFPLAWLFGFWPTVMPILLAARIRRLQGTLEEFVQRRAAGLPTEESRQELEDTFTLLAAEENGVPEFLVRPVVRRFLRSPQS